MASTTKNFKPRMGNTRLKRDKDNTTPLFDSPLRSQNSGLSVHFDYLRVSGTTDIEITLNPDGKTADFGTCSFKDLFDILFVGRKDTYHIDPYRGWSAGGSAPRYDCAIVTSCGIQGGFSLAIADSLDDKCSNDVTYHCDFMIDFSGMYLDSLNIAQQYTLLQRLHFYYRCKFHRVDIAIDDPSHRYIPREQMRQARRDGDVFRARKYKYIESGCIGKQGNGDITDYYGSRESGKMVRVYEHGEVLRYEAEFKRLYAGAAVDQFLKLRFNPDGKADYDWQYILQRSLFLVAVGAIDFRQRSLSGAADKSRVSARDCTRWDWWQEFINCGDSDEPFRIRKLKAGTTVERTVQWLERQVFGVLSLIRTAIDKEGSDMTFGRYIDIGCMHAVRKMKKKNEKLYDARLLAVMQDYSAIELSARLMQKV